MKVTAPVFPKTAALVLVDIQRDFCPGGALAVPEGDEIVPIANSLAGRFHTVAATLDWHPPGHSSFQQQGGPWPPHCVQGTPGSEMHPEIDLSKIDVIARKGADLNRDEFRGLAAVTEGGNTLDSVLRSRGVQKLYVAGLATDYCVKATVTDALERGYSVVAITDAMRGVDVNPGDSTRALEEMARLGAELTTSNRLAAGR